VGEGSAERVGYLAGAALLVAATLTVAARWHRRGAELPALTLVGLGSAAAAPFAWSHHWVWFVPLLVVLGHRAIAAGDRAAGVLAAVVLLGTTAVITARPGPGVGPIPRTGLISLFPDTYLVLFLVVLVVMAVAPARDRRFGG
jgi:alpha-1,2-mannosyltransferase